MKHVVTSKLVNCIHVIVHRFVMNITRTEETLLLKAGEVAKLLNISRGLAYRWMREGILPTVRSGKVVRVPAAKLPKWIEQNTTAGQGQLPELATEWLILVANLERE